MDIDFELHLTDLIDVEILQGYRTDFPIRQALQP